MTNLTPISPEKSIRSPFARSAAALIENGYLPLPIDPASKRPAVYVGRVTGDTIAHDIAEGRDPRPLSTPIFRGLEDWAAIPAADIIEKCGVWSRMPGAPGVGVRHSAEFVGFDYDHSDSELGEKIAALLDTLPGVVVARRGAKGWARYFRADGSIQSGRIALPGERGGVVVADILAAGRQSVIPPSIHPGTSRPYVWLTSDTLTDTPLDRLPRLRGAVLEQIRSIVADHFEIDLDALPAPAGPAPARAAKGWRDPLGDMALANLESWIPALGLARCRPVRGGYAAVAEWRPSGSGRSLSDRKRNLSATPRGITDFGDEMRGYSPTQLVEAALGLDRAAAWQWLADRLGYTLPPSWEPAAPTTPPTPEPPQEATGAIWRPEPTLTADDIAKPLGEALRGFLGRVEDYADSPAPGDAPQGLVRVSLGAGKSRSTIEAVADLVARRPDIRVLVRLPDHGLASQFGRDLEAALKRRGEDRAGLATWRGREQPDPRPEAAGFTMCRKLEIVASVEKVGGRLADVCRGCPFKPTIAMGDSAVACGYRLQGGASDARVVLISGDTSLARLPTGIKRRRAPDKHGVIDTRPDFDLIVLDETSPTSLVEGADSGGSRVGLDVLRADLEAMAAAAAHTPELDPWSRGALASTLAAVDGALASGRHVTSAELRGAGLTLASLQAAERTIWHFMPKLPRDAGLAAADPDEIGERFAAHGALVGTVRAISRLLRALTQGLEDAERHGASADTLPIPQIALSSVSSRAGPRRSANLSTRRRLDKAIAETPTLILDATPEIELLRAWFPRLETIADLQARDGAGVRRIQVTGWAGSLASLDPSSPYAGPDARTNAARMAMLQGLLERATGGRVGLIVPKGTREFLAANGADDGGMLHFGAVRGRNDFESVAGLVVAGRQLPPVRSAERLASVIVGRQVEEIRADDNGRVFFETVPGWLHLRDGSLAPTTALRHPDPAVEAVRRSIGDAERLQALGRSRAVRRTEDAPLTEIVVGDGDTGLHVDAVVDWGDLVAATTWIGCLLLAGAWPTGPKSSQGRAAILLGLQSGENAQSIDAVSSRSFPIYIHKGNHDLRGTFSDPVATKRFFDNQLRQPGKAELVAAIDSAIQSGASSVRICGLDFPLAGFVTAPLDHGGRYVTPTALQAGSVREAVERAEGLGVEIAATFGDLRKGRVLADLPSGFDLPGIARLQVAFTDAARHAWQRLERLDGGD